MGWCNGQGNDPPKAENEKKVSKFDLNKNVAIGKAELTVLPFLFMPWIYKSLIVKTCPFGAKSIFMSMECRKKIL